MDFGDITVFSLTVFTVIILGAIYLYKVMNVLVSFISFESFSLVN